MPTTRDVGATNGIATLWRGTRSCWWKPGDAVDAGTATRDFGGSVGAVVSGWTFCVAEIDGVRPSVVDEGGKVQGELYVFSDASSCPGVCVWVGVVSNLDVMQCE